MGKEVGWFVLLFDLCLQTSHFSGDIGIGDSSNKRRNTRGNVLDT